MTKSRSLRRMPRGFTIIEAVVATLLLAIGAIALASTSAWSARLGADARAIERQAGGVQDIADSLRRLPCATLTSGSVVASGAAVSWSVRRIADVAQVVIVAPAPARRSASLPVEIIIPCE